VEKRGFSSRLASDEITTHGYRVLTFAKCTTIMIVVLVVTDGLRSCFDKMVWMGTGWFWSSFYGTVCSIEPLLDHTLGLIQHN
jgi:hypothetical protein